MHYFPCISEEDVAHIPGTNAVRKDSACDTEAPVHIALAQAIAVLQTQMVRRVVIALVHEVNFPELLSALRKGLQGVIIEAHQLSVPEGDTNGDIADGTKSTIPREHLTLLTVSTLHI